MDVQNFLIAVFFSLRCFESSVFIKNLGSFSSGRVLKKDCLRLIFRWIVGYFDPRTGALHAVCWLKSIFLLYLHWVTKGFAFS